MLLALPHRELVLNSVNIVALGALLNIGAVPRPSGLGIKVRSGMMRGHARSKRNLCSNKVCMPWTTASYRVPQDYGGGVKTLALCPSSPNCVATSEELNDPTHYVPPWCAPLPKHVVLSAFACACSAFPAQNATQQNIVPSNVVAIAVDPLDWGCCAAMHVS